jgi:glyoxylase-like metal-dependent hydrolase (beta-lactamase superfamily II)
MSFELKIEKIEDNVYQFNEKSRQNVDAYLVIGSKRAAMIDCLMDATGLYAKARELTELPIDLLITHGHRDHCGVSVQEFKDSGCTVYMDTVDLPLLEARSHRKFSIGFFADIKAVKNFTLGDVQLEVIPLGGHSAGSVVFFDKKRQFLFSSDAIGAGILHLFGPTRLLLHEFRDNLKIVYDELKQYSDLRIYPGHRNQEPVKPLGIKYMRDVYETAELVISGTLVGKPGTIDMDSGHHEFMEAEHGYMKMFRYSPDRI